MKSIQEQAATSYQPTKLSNYLVRNDLRTLDPPTEQIEAFSGQPVHSLGSCVLHLHVDNKAFPTIFEVTNTTGPIMLGRTQAKAMGYVKFPKTKHPHTFTMHPTTSKKICTIKTSVPEIATGFPPTDSIGTTPRVHVHKSESTKQSSPNRLQNCCTTNKIEHRLHRAQWQNTQATHHQRLHVKGVQ